MVFQANQTRLICLCQGLSLAALRCKATTAGTLKTTAAQHSHAYGAEVVLNSMV
jgi:hypothetical protein